jgi:hypothetical protein
MERINTLPYSTIFSLWLLLVLFFSFAYFGLSYVPGHGPVQLNGGMPPLHRFLNSLYYSIITATSTGYGDITPQGFSKALAALQSITALMVFAVFVTKLVTVRQDIALRQVHKLTFEDVYYNLRESFYIIRQDFDRIIELLHNEKNLEKKDWDDLLIAFKQGESFFGDIPSFYNEKEPLYTIDIQREQLLLESVHRTLERVEHLLELLDSSHHVITNEKRTTEALTRFVKTGRDVLFFWQKQSPYDNEKYFEEILGVNGRIQEKIESGT